MKIKIKLPRSHITGCWLNVLFLDEATVNVICSEKILNLKSKVEVSDSGSERQRDRLIKLAADQLDTERLFSSLKKGSSILVLGN